jgi:transcriptional regulator with XRE-family HTH domain
MRGMEILARRLTARLDHLRLSMAELERRTGLHRQTLKKLAAGKATTLPPAASFFRLCKVVGLQPLDLLGLAPGDGETPEGKARETAVREMVQHLGKLDEGRLELTAELLDTLHRHAGALLTPGLGTPEPKAPKERPAAKRRPKAQPADGSPA